MVEYNSSSISNNLANAACNHDRCKSPRSPFGSLGDMNDHCDTEEGYEDGIARNSWPILIDTCRDRACVWTSKGAISGGAICDKAIWEILRRHGEVVNRSVTGRKGRGAGLFEKYGWRTEGVQYI